MNNDEIYIQMNCDACGQSDYNIQTCNKCKKKYCRYKCADKIISINNKLICKSCYGEKLK
jgi:hypothetical protein